MLLNFRQLYEKYNMNISGVIHVGGHTGEEYVTYLQHNVPYIIFFEPIPDSYNRLCNYIAQINSYNKHLELPDVQIHNMALGNKIGTGTLHLSEHVSCPQARGASSSLLTPKKHLELHADVVFNQDIEVEINKLDNFNGSVSNSNFINIDVQGYELEVLKGGTSTLQHVDYIMTEVNIDEVYEGCVKMAELDEYLFAFNFKRVETNMAGGLWGDALYIKQ